MPFDIASATLLHLLIFSFRLSHGAAQERLISAAAGGSQTVNDIPRLYEAGTLRVKQVSQTDTKTENTPRDYMCTGDRSADKLE